MLLHLFSELFVVVFLFNVVHSINDNMNKTRLLKQSTLFGQI